MIRIGIPRALLYYQYYPMWKTFFEELGAEVITSSPTTQAMLSAGSSRVVAETCLPTKIYLGHVLSLMEKCDYLFIPAIYSVKKKSYNCAKLLGLPDMTRAVISEAPPVLDIDIDVNKGKFRLYSAIYKLGSYLVRNPLRVRRAAKTAWQAHVDFRKLTCECNLTLPQAIKKTMGDAFAEGQSECPRTGKERATIAIIGHPYLIYDDHINYRLVHRLEQANNKVVTAEMLTADELTSATSKLVGNAQWACEEEVVGAGGYYLGSGCDGVIGVTAFGCGPDSLMMDVVQRYTWSMSVPFMRLTLDEHTAEAGIVTRIEAFLDMIYHKKEHQVSTCA
ncbi:acyl-CoA dehydratase activase-related protein [Chloroflexota bacterium]